MTTPIKTGDLLPQRQRRSYSYDPERGDTKSEVWQNADEARMWAQAAVYRANRIPYEVVIEDNHATLTTQDPTGEYVIDTWQIENDELSPSCLLNPRHRQTLNGVAPITDEHLAMIADVTRGERDYNAVKALLAGYDRALRLLDRVNAGQTSYFKTRPVVRHTTNVSNRYNYNVASDYVEHIYSPAEFLSEVQDVGLWLFPMPDMLWNALLANPIPDNREGFQWGYLKRPPTVSTAANNRIDVNTLYLLDQWSTEDYDQR